MVHITDEFYSQLAQECINALESGCNSTGIEFDKYSACVDFNKSKVTCFKLYDEEGINELESDFDAAILEERLEEMDGERGYNWVDPAFGSLEEFYRMVS